MRQVLWTCDECHDDDATTAPSVISYDNGHVERLDLCAFCRSEIAGAALDTHGDNEAWADFEERLESAVSTFAGYMELAA